MKTKKVKLYRCKGWKTCFRSYFLNKHQVNWVCEHSIPHKKCNMRNNRPDCRCVIYRGKKLDISQK